VPPPPPISSDRSMAACLQGAHSTEFDPNTPHPVIALLDEQKNVVRKGGTMRLGSQPCQLAVGTKAAHLYGAFLIHERHRHRYEVNPEYVPQLEERGFHVTGLSPDGKFVEIIELEGHPWFLGCQFHPEYKSRPTAPHPLFRSFIAAARSNKTSAKATAAVPAHETELV